MERAPANSADSALDAVAPRPPRRGWLARPAYWLPLVALLTAGVVVGLRARGPRVPTAIVTRADITQHVVASGRVHVPTRVQLAAPIAGRVTAVVVAEGQPVRRGDTLVQLDDREAKAAVAQARASLEQARGRLNQLRRVGAVVTSEASREAAAALERAEAELARTTALTEAGALPRATLEDAQRAAEIARARKRAADAQASAARVDGADWQLNEAAVLESEARLAAATARLADTTVVAPAAGIVLSCAVEPGDSVQAGTALLEIAAEGATELIIEPDERNLARIRLGHTARASADAFPEVIFDAVVRYIAPAVDPRRGSIEVRLLVPSPPPFLLPDMTVSVDLTVAGKSDAIVVPTDALRSVTDDPFVWLVEQGRVSRRAVALGIQGGGHSEITAGLEPGAEVTLGTVRPLENGQRVRPYLEAP